MCMPIQLIGSKQNIKYTLTLIVSFQKLIFIRAWYVYADPINWIKTKYKLQININCFVIKIDFY